MDASNVIDKKVRIALGAPNSDWEALVKAKLSELGQLDTGKLNIRDTRVRLTGTTKVETVKTAVDASIGAVPAGYNASADVKLFKAKPVVKQINTIDACQALFDRLKGDNKVNFASAKAELVGKKTFDLLNNLVKVKKAIINGCLNLVLILLSIILSHKVLRSNVSPQKVWAKQSLSHQTIRLWVALRTAVSNSS